VTTIAAPPRRARSGRPSTARPPARTATTRAPTRTKKQAGARAAAAPLAIGRIGGLLVVVTIAALVTAVVFHVVLAQNQMELDRLNGQIATEQRTYEQRRLNVSELLAPQRVIQEAGRLGLVQPPDPAQTLYVPDAPLPKTDDGTTTDTIRDWSETKPSLGPSQP
jgi:cell division protein FtsL